MTDEAALQACHGLIEACFGQRLAGQQLSRRGDLRVDGGDRLLRLLASTGRGLLAVGPGPAPLLLRGPTRTRVLGPRLPPRRCVPRRWPSGRP